METESQKNEIKIEEVDKSDSETNNVWTQKEEERKAEKKLKVKHSFNDDDDAINILLFKSDNQDSQLESFSTLNTQAEIVADVPVQIHNKNENLTEDENILLSLISEDHQKDSGSELNPVNEIFFKKQELSTQLFSELPSTSTVLVEKEDSTEFLMSLLD